MVTFVSHVIIFMLRFPADTLFDQNFAANFLPSAPAAWAAAPSAAPGRASGGGPSPACLLINSLERVAAASARQAPLATLVAGAPLVCRQLPGQP
jgi:hypothetical protein